MKKSMLKTLGIVILCLGLLYLLFQRGFKEGFEEVIDCKSVEGVRYVRLRPSLFLTGTGNLQAQLTLSQVRVLNEIGTNVALRKNVSVSTGNNTGAGVIVDGAAGPREIGPGQRTWQSSIGNAEEYIEIDLGAATTVASVVYMGALDGPREQNRGVRINLLNSNRQQILGAEELTKEDDVNQTITFCKERQRFEVRFVPIPPEIKCTPQQYRNVPNPNSDALKHHYINAGIQEGRPISLNYNDQIITSRCIFKPLEYVELNPDIKRQFPGTSLEDRLNITNHYKQFGINEDRTICRIGGKDIKFDPYMYLAVNPDLEVLTTKEPNGTQWLCEDENNARKLLKGPFDKATRYLRDGDIVCVKSEYGKGYSCFEPYDGSLDPSYYNTDQTFNDVQDTGNQLCGRAYSYIQDMSATMLEIGRTNTSINTVYDTINRSETDLKTLYTNMKCATQTSGGFKTMCDSINKSLQDIEEKRGTIQAVQGSFNGAVDKIEGSRSLIQDIITRFKCAIA